ncbi:MAG TPA: Asp-tRNA(Asn)/Glu-tRNA(Gln) amidotransferase subunit GatC [Desulfobacteraceae bacterium]|nr:Asp-tRNA(Asn)/Glu-tRNA(Gln) amidotransferase subunit GatC [Desulfobacteraceae bacterium]
MNITKMDVAHIATLARLEVADSQVEKFADQISRTLGYIDKLKEADVSSASLVSDAVFETNVFREDHRQKSPGPDVTLANAPERDDDFYTVPRIVG